MDESTEPAAQIATDEPQTSLRVLALLFLRLGVTAFGGPAAHVAMMEEEVVRRRKWLSHQQFLDLLGATNLIPGPNSTEMAIHIGYLRGGWAGLITAGSCFIFPAMLIVTAIAWMYVSFSKLPQMSGVLYGVKPVIIAVVLQALWRLGRAAIKTRLLVVVTAICILLSAAGMNEIAILVGAGTLLGVVRWAAGERSSGPRPLLILLALAAVVMVLIYGPGLWHQHSSATAAPVSLARMFLFFARIGSILFGSGYVLLAFLRDDLVVHWHWLSPGQLLDAVAVGQVTPGPVFTTATFIGYLLGGVPGALVATAGIFLPAFFFVAVSGPLVPRLRKSPVAGSFLDGVNAASLALMAVVTWQLGRAAVVDPLTLTLAAASAVLLLRWQVNSAWLVLTGAVVGLASSMIWRSHV